MCPKQFVHSLAIYSLSDLKSTHAVPSNRELLAKLSIPSRAEPGETWFTGCQNTARNKLYLTSIAVLLQPDDPLTAVSKQTLNTDITYLNNGCSMAKICLQRSITYPKKAEKK